MEKISVLMDGELGRRECKAQLKRLEGDAELSEGWDTYHLIGDVLRREAAFGPDFQQRLHQRLEQEPMVIAPHQLPFQRMMRHSLPLAAGFGGIALVAWLAVSLQPFMPQPTNLAAKQPTQLSNPIVPETTAALPASVQGAAGEYLRAHQEFALAAGTQSIPSFARTVSLEQGEASQ